MTEPTSTERDPVAQAGVTADAQVPRAQRPTRLRRLCQFLAAMALLWLVVSLARWLLPPSPLKVARDSVEVGRFDVAIDNYLRHLAQEPQDWPVRLELGVLLTASNRPQALYEFRKIPPESEVYPEALRQIAAICLDSDRLQEAEEALLQLEKRSPEDGPTQLLLAEVYFRQQRARTALPYAQKAAELLSEQPRPHFLLAEIYDELDRPSEMIEPLKRVLALQPEDYGAHLNLGYALATVGEAAQARREAEWCLRRNPADVHARRFLAMAARDEGNREEALLEVQRALELAPEELECRLLEAELLLFERQAQQALERLQPLYELHQNDRRLAALLARAADGAGKAEEAEKYRAQVQKLSER